MTVPDERSRYTQAVIELSKRSGADVVEIPRGATDTAQFFKEYASQPKRWLDWAAAEGGEHGAVTHMFQEHILDRSGLPGHEFRVRLINAKALDGSAVGELVWAHMFDPISTGTITEPEKLWPVLRDLLPGIE